MHFEQFVDTPLPLCCIEAENAAKKIDVFKHRQRRVKIAAQALGHISDSLCHFGAHTALPRISAKHFDKTGLNFTCSSDEAEQCRLTNAVGTDNTRHTPRGYAEIDVIEGNRGAVAMRHAAQARDDGIF